MSTTNFAIFLIGILAIVLVSFGDFGIKHKSKVKISRGWRMIIVSVITLSSMHYFDKNPRYNPDFNLENKIVDSIELSGNIDLSKVTDFNFKKVYICNDKVNKYDIVDDILFVSSYKEVEDDRNYIIFVNEKNKVIKYTGLNKKYQILNSSLRMYSKKDAIFKFDKLRYNDKTVYELK
ncbi:TPA: hypothetical protein ACKONR_000442 [Clostridioides difficile]|uniref:hypothetical protein n=1 Tax=Clostridioides difficile TaxID=1496 RepID=UPI000826DD09|nr:hypothetical protein [Clostridioides difficile]MDV9854190.1 hypothetical protein [Clostridioides difficile]HBE9726999.1 hypothetical protein [Clostridioides difficile]HBF1102492.1 hypothetical protein [Clostridioides difficile]HBF1291792.1 hypothetical protein [Clostridioides difficile]HBF3642702.1 hypothetical protein [Clostridioides difficile]